MRHLPFCLLLFSWCAGAQEALPAPGTCSAPQPGLKTCSALPNGEGAFEVFTKPPAALFLRFPEPITRLVPPPDAYFLPQFRPGDQIAALVPQTDHLPAKSTVLVTTQSLSITITLRPATKQQVIDTQIAVVDPQHDQRTAQLRRAMTEAEKTLRGKVTVDLRDAEFDDIAHAGADLRDPREHTIARNGELIVLEANRVLRIGSRNLLLFTVRNRSGEDFHAKAVHLWVGDRDLQPPWKLARTKLAPAQDARGVLELPADLHGLVLRLRVDEDDPKRSVELAGVKAQ
jgi:hypothetical protein